MNTFARRVRNWLHLPVPPRIFPTTGFKVLDHVAKLEEENWEWYSPEAFYPVRIGEVLKSRYQVLGKLGYGAHSTAWLCRDLPKRRYVALKVCEVDSLSARREMAAYERLSSVTTNHIGALLMRHLLDSFQIKCPHGDHQVLVHEPLAMSVETLRQLMSREGLPLDLLKAIIRHLLLALDCLHREVKMVHTDIQARNIHLGIEDEDILKDFENREMTTPSARKVDGDRIIYESRGFKLPRMSGRPILCDFGEARVGDECFSDEIQPYVYRAPEVILDIPWTYPVDVWNVGVLIWDLLENKQLFTARGGEGNRSIEHHLAEMVAFMGSPPVKYLGRSDTAKTYFDSEGTWKSLTPIPDISLEASVTRLTGEDKVLFLNFLRKILQWAPEQRPTPQQLLEDPWLKNVEK